MIRRWPLLVLLVLVGCAIRIEVRQPRVLGRDFIVSRIGSGTACTDAAPCTPKYAIQTMSCTAGDLMTMLDGTYQGADFMFNPGDWAFGKSGSDAAHVCTVRARNDGRVFIDGQGVRYPFWMDGNSWWAVSGIDIGNTGGSNGNNLLDIRGSHFNTFKRICVSNVAMRLPLGSDYLGDGLRVSSSHDNLFEDICSFGSAGNNMIDKDGSTLNTYRRLWVRWEGGYVFDPRPTYALDCGGPPFQLGYGARHTSTFENVITIYDPEQTPVGSVCNTSGTGGGTAYGSTLIRNTAWVGDTGYLLRGWILYGYNDPNLGIYSPGYGAYFNQAHSADNDSNGELAINVQDLFVDATATPTAASAQGTGPLHFECNPGFCGNMRVTRVTSIRGSMPASYHSNQGEWALSTNMSECTTFGNCPNFYTGAAQGSGSTPGARNCFEYTDGVLGSVSATQGLWPWRMDSGGLGQFPSRIKSALARAKAAGLGGSALAGAAGTGYEAGTVTSEIVSRYGPIPAACTRSGAAFVPDFPVVTDFPSTPILDNFNRANGGIGANYTALSGLGVNVSGNTAVPVSGASRVLWNPDAFAGVHEVYKTMTTAPADGTAVLLLIFGANSLSNVGYHVILNRVASANDTLSIYRLSDGATILGPIDLGTDVQSGDLFGVRVNATQTISLYWKYNGTTFRVGTVIDTNLPSANIRIGFGTTDGEADDDFGGGTCCGGVTPNPGTIGRFGLRFPTQ